MGSGAAGFEGQSAQWTHSKDGGGVLFWKTGVSVEVGGNEWVQFRAGIETLRRVIQDPVDLWSEDRRKIWRIEEFIVLIADVRLRNTVAKSGWT